MLRHIIFWGLEVVFFFRKIRKVFAVFILLIMLMMTWVEMVLKWKKLMKTGEEFFRWNERVSEIKTFLRWRKFVLLVAWIKWSNQCVQEKNGKVIGCRNEGKYTTHYIIMMNVTKCKETDNRSTFIFFLCKKHVIILLSARMIVVSCKKKKRFFRGFSFISFSSFLGRDGNWERKRAGANEKRKWRK